MAAESLLGGSTSDTLSDSTKALLDAILGDTVDSNVEVTTLDSGGSVVVGAGADGEAQSVVVSNGAAVVADVTDGVFTVALELPANVDMSFEGLSELATPAQATAYLTTQIDAALPADSADANVLALRASLEKAVSNVSQALESAGVTDAVVRVVNFADTSTTSDTAVVIDGTTSGSNEVLALVVGSLKAGTVVDLKGVENAVVVGGGSVTVTDGTSTRLEGDSSAQQFTGGSGNDTLVGGGNDTLVGGAGDDTIVFNGVGNFSVDLSGGGDDTLAFQFNGINSLDDLVQYVTGVTESNGNVTYHFGEAASITLIGLSAADVTADMVSFIV
jgi:hypothetical protein